MLLATVDDDEKCFDEHPDSRCVTRVVVPATCDARMQNTGPRRTPRLAAALRCVSSSLLRPPRDLGRPVEVILNGRQRSPRERPLRELGRAGELPSGLRSPRHQPAASQRIVLPAAQDAPLYLLAYGVGVHGWHERGDDRRAFRRPLSHSESSRSDTRRQARRELTVFGAGFDGDTEFALVHSKSGDRIDGDEVDVVSPHQAFVELPSRCKSKSGSMTY